MPRETRQINVAEAKKLRKEISRVSKDIAAPLKWNIIITCTLLGLVSAIHIYYFDKSNWSLISKFLVCVCPIIIWVAVDLRYKGRKEKQQYLEELREIADTGNITILKMPTSRAIVFEEKDDEGTLYLIEDNDGVCMYIWDDQWLIPGKLKFPKATNEIYLDKPFIWALSRKVNCFGAEVETINIPGDAKWTFFEKRGFPADFDKPDQSFDSILASLEQSKKRQR